MKFVFIDGESYVNEALLGPLRSLGEVEIYSGVPDSDAEAVRRGRDADVIFFAIAEISDAVLAQLPKLKILQFCGTGVGTFVNVPLARSRGIRVFNIGAYGSTAVAEFALGLLFAAARRIPAADRIMKSGGWTIDGLCGVEIDGATVGVVGTGSIGSIFAKKAAALGAQVLVHARNPSAGLAEGGCITFVSLEELFKRSDFISLHLAVNAETAGIISRQLIDSMKPGAFLINTARAGLVDGEALYEALASGRIAGAAVDVYDHEPPADRRLILLDNVIATPHVAFYTQNASDNAVRLSIRSVLEALEKIRG